MFPDLPASPSRPIWTFDIRSNLRRPDMSAVERLEDRQEQGRLDADPVMDAVVAAEALVEKEGAPEARARLRPLLAVSPYKARYRGRAVLALISLTIAALPTLVVPVAVRRMIDFGFRPEGIAKKNKKNSVMIGVVAVLA